MDAREMIRKEIERLAELPEGSVGYDDDLDKFSIDSVIIVQLAAMLEDEFDVILPDEKLQEIKNINSIVKIIEELKNE